MLVWIIGVEKSGKNAEGDSWWETWQEVLHQDEWRWDTQCFMLITLESAHVIPL